MVTIRKVQLDDLPVIAELMHDALSPFYGGDHRAHARRIVTTAAVSEDDRNGHFSLTQVMYVAEIDGSLAGIINLVVKKQGTLKINPLIVSPEHQGKGAGKVLFEQTLDYARTMQARQIYCTVSLRNKTVLSFFKQKGFLPCGVARGHYRPDLDEVMLYLPPSEYAEAEHIISVVPFSPEDEQGVRDLVLDQLPQYFNGVDQSWVSSMFAGYERRHNRDPEEKYKLLWVAKSPDKQILGVVAATPKKGEPIKLMPLAAAHDEAFAALLTDLPGHLDEYGHKLYTHIVPTPNRVRLLQLHGWTIELMLPEAYKPGITTQQWAYTFGRPNMRTLRVRKPYFNAIFAGTKTLEVRVGYCNIKNIRDGEQIQFQCGPTLRTITVAKVRKYPTFAAMLAKEDARQVVPSDPQNALRILQEIYPAEKEALGVYVLQLQR